MKGSTAGAVVIGRNEGARLGRCLESIVGLVSLAVYVDSGSTDGSVELAKGMGVEVVELDMSIPFTAARARNAGMKRLLAIAPASTYVQFVDGDCELQRGWIDRASAYLEDHVDVAMVCGRLRERHPDKSIYNRLCDIEWDKPIGEIKACGGIAMARVKAVCDAGGFRENLIAGEEPELCVRLRLAGWRIWSMRAEMALHDANMTRFIQWWRRLVRGGYAFAEGSFLHGAPPMRHCVNETRRIWFWGLGLPLFSVACVAAFGWTASAVLAIYPLQVIRLAFRGRSDVKENWLRAFFLVLAKFPELQGQLTFWWRKVSSGRTALIEYK
jgi:glycosyltransferase involved in cell wall biosynthesis